MTHESYDLSDVTFIMPVRMESDHRENNVRTCLKYLTHHLNTNIILMENGPTSKFCDVVPPKIQNQVDYIYQQNKGVSSARNKGIVHSTGNYIAFLDCDDMYAPNKISRSIENINLELSNFVSTPAYIIDKDDKIIKKYEPAKGILLWRNYICNSTPVMRKDVFDKVGLFDENFFICADWDMWLRISEKYPMFYFDEYLTYYRV